MSHFHQRSYSFKPCHWNAKPNGFLFDKVSDIYILFRSDCQAVLYKKGVLKPGVLEPVAHVFSCEFCQTFKNTQTVEHLRILERLYRHDKNIIPVGTGRKLNVHKTLRKRPGHLLNVLCTFSLPPVSPVFTIRLFSLLCKTLKHPLEKRSNI